ncbi:carboxymuconolactone decarboxylase family protein [Yersinia mollaretii]|uniref:carboxymuconolactone decarboxylase family protein n=1 Tax=Yersinia mollaretii TaxID=33060 RepID=UPI0011A732A4|nr:carboxymuconolactone decarboxylase family protein [Yersinia mollaretii]MDN0112913.1 carboxymuconolactone decarboxylase family protein [Yersinia mollaretii]
MVQFRQQDNAHWYHETQRSGSLEITTAQVSDTSDSVTRKESHHPHNSESVAEQGLFLLGLDDGIPAALAQNLQHHATVLSASDALYQVLFPPIVDLNRDNHFSLYDRLSSALTVAQVTGVQRLCSHYAARLTPLSSPDASRESNMRLTQITQYARQLASQPTLIDRHALQQLSEVGLSEADIIVLSQIIGFVGYQARVVAGLSALAGYPTVMLPGFPRMEDASADLIPATVPQWQGWLPSLATLDNIATESPSDETQVTLHDLLEHDPQSLSAYQQVTQQQAPQQIPADWLALVALVSARINGSIYCQAHHQQQLTTDLSAGYASTIDVIVTGVDSALATLPVHQMAHPLIFLSAELTRAPERFSHQSIRPLLALGVSHHQLLSLIITTATAGWTNRLRQALGATV